MGSTKPALIKSTRTSSYCRKEGQFAQAKKTRQSLGGKLIQLLPITGIFVTGRFLDLEATKRRVTVARWLGLVSGALAGCFFGVIAAISGGIAGLLLIRCLDLRVFLREYDFSFLLQKEKGETGRFRGSRTRTLPVIADEDIEQLMSRHDSSMGDDLLDLLDLFSLTREQLLLLTAHMVKRKDLDDILVKLRAHILRNKIRNYIPWLVRLRFILSNISRCLNERSAMKEQKCLIRWREDFLARFVDALGERIAQG
ncbi:MAG: hypothetical protein ACR2PT_10220 [Endozoicomonas sp.]